MSMLSKKNSWFSKLKTGLSNSSNKITQGINQILAKKKLDIETLEQLEELLLSSDIGYEATSRIIADLKKNRFDKDIDLQEIKQELALSIENILEPVSGVIKIEHKPQIILVCGVNGNGKTTTIGKLANYFKQQNKEVMLAACDTFRAAAVEQLTIWADRNNCEIVKAELGSDPASVAFKAAEQAQKKQVDILLVDTAGRLHNKNNLMDELAKIVRVIKKIDEGAPHNILLVLDATTGQNAHMQVAAFKDIVNINGLVVTKLDGTAKGGVVVALAQKFQIPIIAIGVGEGIDDLRPFSAKDFANNLININ